MQSGGGARIELVKSEGQDGRALLGARAKARFKAAERSSALEPELGRASPSQSGHKGVREHPAPDALGCARQRALMRQGLCVRRGARCLLKYA